METGSARNLAAKLGMHVVTSTEENPCKVAKAIEDMALQWPYMAPERP